MSGRQTGAGNDTPAAPCPLSITVAICTRNRAALLRPALESVLPQLTDDTEVLIVDNASTDETSAVARAYAERDSRVRAIREDELGLSAARNTALRQARGGYVVFLDDDATAESGWLAAYREIVLNPPAPNLAGLGGPVFPKYEIPPPWWVHPRANTLDWSDQPQDFGRHSPPWGCNFAVRRDLALTAGGFNPILGRKGGGMGAHEETELLEKLKADGGGLWWVPRAGIRHLIPKNRLAFGANCRAEFTQGRSTAIYRYRPRPDRARRTAYRLGRAAVAPFHCLVCFIAAAGALLFQGRMLAAQHIFRASRNAGLGWQLTLDFFAPGTQSGGSGPQL